MQAWPGDVPPLALATLPPAAGGGAAAAPGSAGSPQRRMSYGLANWFAQRSGGSGGEGRPEFAASPDLLDGASSLQQQTQFGGKFETLRSLAAQLRRENQELRDAYDRRLASGARGGYAASSVESCSDWEQQSDSHQHLSSYSDDGSRHGRLGDSEGGLLASKVAGLARDLRKALKRAVDKRRDIEDAHIEAEEAHERFLARAQQEVDTAEADAAATEERTARERAAQLHEALERSARRTITNPDALFTELHSERAERDARRRRSAELREELKGAGAMREELAAVNADRQQRQFEASAALAPLGRLSRKVARLRSELRAHERGDEAELQELAREELMAEAAEGGPEGLVSASRQLRAELNRDLAEEELAARNTRSEQRLAELTHEIELRRLALDNERQRLEQDRAEMRLRGAEIVESERGAHWRRARSRAVESECEDLCAEEAMADNAPIAAESWIREVTWKGGEYSLDPDFPAQRVPSGLAKNLSEGISRLRWRRFQARVSDS
eukprot:TRINITY_DN11563_c0_g1_i3.p1 TRINITY_DN11563_c0_g1~~TRINITY_DN11563_c0_g1_i3.p1  ORF type:complete len:572 (-),score=168.67 TRINITY_DN11563_c0_g1_i3:375-1886(-)